MRRKGEGFLYKNEMNSKGHFNKSFSLKLGGFGGKGYPIYHVPVLFCLKLHTTHHTLTFSFILQVYSASSFLMRSPSLPNSELSRSLLFLNSNQAKQNISKSLIFHSTPLAFFPHLNHSYINMPMQTDRLS